MLKLVFIANLVSTIFMCGVIWIVQVVHYPLFAKVGDALFREYHADHNVLITYIVLPAMLIEIGTAGLLILGRPDNVTSAEAWIGLGLVLLAWGATFFLSVPAHTQLAPGFDAQAHRMLVQTNWLRTFAWSARTALVAWQVYKLL
ncbi:MAG: hypothetical protein AAGD96_13435 [Chloroflexota bacterium]